MSSPRPHRLTTVAALSCLIASAGLTTSVAEIERRDAEVFAERARQPAEGTPTVSRSEIRVYDLGEMHADDDEIDRWFENMNALFNIRWARVGPGQWAVRATDIEHDRLEPLIERAVRSVPDDDEDDHDDDDHEFAEDGDAPTYSVRFLAVQLSAADTPPVGRPLASLEGERLANPHLIVREDEAAEVEFVTQQSYIAGYQPVVSANTVAYDVQIDRLESGFGMRCSIERADDGRAIFRVDGTISRGDVRQETLVLGEARLPLGLPFVTRRSLEIEATVELGRTPVTIMVGDGFEPGTRLVVAVAIEPLDDDR